MGSATEHDALWFVNSAKAWYWNRPYTWTAFVRPPSYPLFIAVVHSLRIPLRLAIELTQLSGALALTLALRRAQIARTICVACFGVLVLHPYGFQALDYTMADWFYGATLMFLIAGFILVILGPAQKLMSILTGIALAVLWNTREETALLVLLSIVFLGLWFIRTRVEIGESIAALKRIMKPGGLMIGTSAVLILAVYITNWLTFGAFAKSDMSSPSYRAAFHSLQRIKSPDARRFVPIPSDSLQKAFAVSPTFAVLKPYLNGEVGEGWRIETARSEEANHEIGVNWLMWAIRDAANLAGVFENPEKAHNFFRNVAHEVNSACDDGRIESRFVFGDFFDPLTAKGWNVLPQSIWRIVSLFGQRYEIRPLQDDNILWPDQAALYDEMTLRRPSRWKEHEDTISLQTEKWIARNHRHFVFALSGMRTIAIVALLLRFRRIDWGSGVYICVVIIGFAVASRIALFSVIDATSWSFPFGRFLFPVMPLLNAMSILLIYAAWRDTRPAFH